jgi:hypothetical protein
MVQSLREQSSLQGSLEGTSALLEAQEATELLTASSAPHSLRVHYIQAAASPVTVVTGSIDSRHSQRR